VWTLPPTLRTHAKDQPSPPGFDAAKYPPIGESDRMTLRFAKV
jgi:predicted methyltransferase